MTLKSNPDIGLGMRHRDTESLTYWDALKSAQTMDFTWFIETWDSNDSRRWMSGADIAAPVTIVRLGVVGV